MANESGSEKHFDRALAREFEPALEINDQALGSFLKRCGIGEGRELAAEEALATLGAGRMTKHGFLVNNAGILFFAREPQKYIQQHCITCVRYQGNTMINTIDKKEFMGGMLTIVDEAEAFVRRHTRVASKYLGFKRVDIEEYPYLAVREAIINALAHRDYSFDTTNVYVNIYDERIDVISPGSIPRGLSLKKVWGKSCPRNFLIVELFKKAGEIEKQGTGLAKMNNLMEKHGLEKPAYDASAFFTVTFKGPGEKILDLVKPTNEVDLRELGLNGRQIKVLNYMQTEKVITVQEYAKLYGVTLRSAQRDLNELIEKDLIKRMGVGRATRYLLS